MPPKGTTGDETQIRLKSAASTELDAWTPPVQDREGARCLEQQTTPLTTPEDMKRQNCAIMYKQGSGPEPHQSVPRVCLHSITEHGLHGANNSQTQMTWSAQKTQDNVKRDHYESRLATMA